MPRVSSNKGEQPSPPIEKVGAAIVRDKKVLVVRKEGQPSAEFFTAGGKIEEGETHHEALVRELREELGVTVEHIEYLGSFHDIAVFEAVPIVIHAYYVEVTGEPRPAAEIRECKWIDKNDRNRMFISSIMADQIIPALERAGRL
jgi:8-oxo-dGTP diphosphatase